MGWAPDIATTACVSAGRGTCLASVLVGGGCLWLGFWFGFPFTLLSYLGASVFEPHLLYDQNKQKLLHLIGNGAWETSGIQLLSSGLFILYLVAVYIE